MSCSAASSSSSIPSPFSTTQANVGAGFAARFGSGQAVQRMEDAALLQGQGRFVDNIAQPGDAWAVFVRSPYAHAAIESIDSSAALALPGVQAVITGADLLAAQVPPMATGAPFQRTDGSACASPQRYPLAVERVRFVGEAVALVVADSQEQALNAAEAVAVDYAELPIVASLQAALQAQAQVVDSAPDNIACQASHGDAQAAAQAFAQAAHVVQLRLEHQRLAALTMEPRATRAQWDSQAGEGGRLLLWTSAQAPSAVRAAVAKTLGLPAEAVRVQVGDVGGGFGMKSIPYPEDLALAWAARATGRSLRWMAERSEDFASATPGRDICSHAALALDAQGRILALRVHSDANVGAYPLALGVVIQLLVGPWVQTSVYDIPVIDFQFRALLTHQAPIGAYRGAGRPEAIYNIERLMDEAARQTGIDRIHLRQRNMIAPTQMPYTNAMGQVYDVGDFPRMLEQALALADWQGFAARAQESAARGCWRGLGIASFLEWTGGNVFKESVTVDIRAEGDDGQGVVEVFSAVNPMGQGIATSLAQLVVDVFDLPLEQVRVVLGDTDRGNGFGSSGSRSLFTGGSAIHTGAQQALEQALQLAAQALEAAPQDIGYQGGRFTVSGTDHSIGLFELAARQTDGVIALAHTNRVDGPSWPNATHISEVEIDPATGEVQVLSYSGMNDVGRIVNPPIVRGQLEGGALQGIGQALLEQIAYDPDSGQLITGSLMDYAAPRAHHAPLLLRTEMDTSIPCRNNPLGVKGVGELGTIGATPCIVNAVADALARAGHGELCAQLQMPLTPGKLWGYWSGRTAQQ
ncbi:MAG: xanthine dehydrogenase family protein molybdopterin-binding subunit [Comamonas sp.]|nr:xanthine dehydrogenase family protein molybdopterin-binding subunit [Comamonas sp.]